jgi:hypothetical protein
MVSAVCNSIYGAVDRVVSGVNLGISPPQSEINQPLPNLRYQYQITRITKLLSSAIKVFNELEKNWRGRPQHLVVGLPR